MNCLIPWTMFWLKRKSIWRWKRMKTYETRKTTRKRKRNGKRDKEHNGLCLKKNESVIFTIDNWTPKWKCSKLYEPYVKKILFYRSFQVCKVSALENTKYQRYQRFEILQDRWHVITRHLLADLVSQSIDILLCSMLF